MFALQSFILYTVFIEYVTEASKVMKTYMK